MLEQIVSVMPLYTTNKPEFIQKSLALLREHGATSREDIDAKPITSLEDLVKEVNQFAVYQDIDLLFAVIHETAVSTLIDKKDNL